MSRNHDRFFYIASKCDIFIKVAFIIMINKEKEILDLVLENYHIFFLENIA